MAVSLRKQFSTGWNRIVFWVVAAAMIIGFGMPSLLKQQRGASDTVAVINGHEVSARDLRRRIESTRDRLASFKQQSLQMGFKLSDEFASMDPKELAFDSLVSERVVSVAADKLGVALSDDYVAQQLFNPQFIMRELSDYLPAHAFSQGFAPSMIVPALKRRGISVSEFEDALQDAIKRQLLGQVVADSVHEPQFMLKTEYQQEYAPKTLSVLTFNRADFVKEAKKAKPTDEQLQAFFDEQNSATRRYATPEKRCGTVWKFLPSAYGVQVTDADVQRYYEEHKGEYKIDPVKVSIRYLLFDVPEGSTAAEVEEHAQQVHAQLVEDPSLFAQRAKELSADKASAKNGGLIGLVKRDELEDELGKAVFRLKADGDITTVLPVEKGFAIAQRVERKAATYQPADQVKKDIVNRVRNEQFKRRFSQDCNRAMAQGADVVAALIADKGAQPSDIKMTAHADKPDVQKLFSLKKDGYGFYRQDDAGYLVHVDAIEKSSIPTLASVKARVTSDWYESQADTLLKDATQKAIETARASDLQAGRGTFGAISTYKWIDPQDAEAVQMLREAQLPVEQMLRLTKVGAVFSSESDDRSVIIKLDDIKPFDEQAFQAHRQQLAHAVESRLAYTFYRGFIASLHRNATIETRESALRVT